MADRTRDVRPASDLNRAHSAPGVLHHDYFRAFSSLPVLASTITSRPPSFAPSLWKLMFHVPWRVAGRRGGADHHAVALREQRLALLLRDRVQRSAVAEEIRLDDPDMRPACPALAVAREGSRWPCRSTPSMFADSDTEDEMPRRRGAVGLEQAERRVAHVRELRVGLPRLRACFGSHACTCRRAKAPDWRPASSCTPPPRAPAPRRPASAASAAKQGPDVHAGSPARVTIRGATAIVNQTGRQRRRAAAGRTCHPGKAMPRRNAGGASSLHVAYGRAIVITGEVQVSQCAGLWWSPSAFNTDTLTT